MPKYKAIVRRKPVCKNKEFIVNVDAPEMIHDVACSMGADSDDWSETDAEYELVDYELVEESKLSEDDYAEGGGNACPACNSTQIEGGSFDANDSGVTLEMNCLDCGASWISTYTCCGFMNLRDENNTDLAVKPDKDIPFGDSDLIAMLAVHMDQKLRETPMPQGGWDWGYGNVEIYADLHLAAAAISEALDANIEYIPGVPMYELPDYLPPIPMDDPAQWVTNIQEQAQGIVGKWLHDSEVRSFEARFPGVDRLVGTDFVCPLFLNPDGIEAWKIVMKYLNQAYDNKPYTGGCPAFYSPKVWKERGEEFGTESELLVVYDGGDVGPLMKMELDNDLFEKMQEELDALGMYFDQCTHWYGAIYKDQ